KADIPRYAVEKMIPQMKELVEAYRPNLLFTDGEWSYTSEQWHSLDFITWLYNESSVRDEIVINDRWGRDTRGLHGGYLSCEYGEVNSPAVAEQEAQQNLGRRKWEENRSIGASFGYNRNEDVADYLSESELIELLVDTVSRGGNLCLNVGPCADGTIAPLIQERLTQLGEWMDVNGEAIYGTRAARELILPESVRATRKGRTVYLFCTGYSGEEFRVSGGGFINGAKAQLLGSSVPVVCQCEGDTLVLKAPPLTAGEMPSRHICTFKISG
ncbi:MAG: alpha-L-fucosidase, partial [Clostridiales bacterium]|nr:alpha-L-fucosidase [Clostridiales bacterium]